MADDKSVNTAGKLATAGVAILTVLAFVPGAPYAVSVIAVILAIVFGQFLYFLYAMARSARRSAPVVAIYATTNIASILLLFGCLYRWLGLKDTLLNAEAFEYSTSFYFSVVTWTTLGYGDVIPLEPARPVAAIEALLGYVVMALLIAVVLAMLKRD